MASLGFVAMEMKAAGFSTLRRIWRTRISPRWLRRWAFYARRVERAEDVEAALTEAFAHEGPALLDVVTAKHELAMPPHMDVAQIKGFSLFLLKAVINGRGEEIVDLARANLRF